MTGHPAPHVFEKHEWPPNYISVYAWRQKMIAEILADPKVLEAVLMHYSTSPIDFICHWVDTTDPRNAYSDSKPVQIPFVLFKRQAEFIEFLTAALEDQANGLVDKTRDVGATWLASAFSVWLWRFKRGAAVGWGSRKEEIVDKLGDPKTIFEKIRTVVRNLPPFFLPRGFDMNVHATFMRLINPENGATIIGEGGDNIGRGGRTLVYFKDESAHYEHSELIEAALMSNTNVQIDISTTSGVGTVYDRKKESGRIWEPDEPRPPRNAVRVFVFDWRDHPEKTEEWHRQGETAARDAGLLHLFKQEVDRDASSALQGIIIKPEWAKACVDADLELGFVPSGGWCGGFDPYDEGGDSHALAFRRGMRLEKCADWSEGDTGAATRFVIGETLGMTPMPIQYDCCGIGAGVKSEANRLRDEKKLPLGVSFHPWDAGDGPIKPKERVIPGDLMSPLNEDFYANLKAQAAWQLARRCERVYRMRNEKGLKFKPDELISISSKIPKLRQLLREMSQPVMKKSGNLKLLIDKKPEGAKSPNMFDAMSMCYFPAKVPMSFPSSVVDATGRR